MVVDGIVVGDGVVIRVINGVVVAERVVVGIAGGAMVENIVEDAIGATDATDDTITTKVVNMPSPITFVFFVILPMKNTIYLYGLLIQL